MIKVVGHNPQWSTAFEQEKQLILAALPPSNVVEIHHIGSTSVPGLAAKPIIDIMLEVHSLAQLDAESGHLLKLNYLVKGESGMPGRRFFQKGGIQRSHQLHAFLTGSENVRRYLAFRDYLREFPDIRDQYDQLKRTGAALYSDDINKYMAHKDAFIKYHQQQAMAWKKLSNRTSPSNNT